MLVETVNNLLQYQYEGNSVLVYSLLLQRQIFENLSSLSLETALQVFEEVQGLRLAQGSPSSQATSDASLAAAAGAGSSLSDRDVDSIDRDRDRDRDRDVDGERERIVPPAGASAGATSLIDTVGVDESGARSPNRVSSSSSNTSTSSSAAAASTSVRKSRANRAKMGNNKAAAAGGSPPNTGPNNARFNPEGHTSNGDGIGNGNSNGATQGSDGGNASPNSENSESDVLQQSWKPTAEWIASVKSELPLGAIQRLLKHLGPQINSLSQEVGVTEAQLLQFIKETTMVGLLPVPHPIVIRRYQPNRYVDRGVHASDQVEALATPLSTGERRFLL